MLATLVKADPTASVGDIKLQQTDLYTHPSLCAGVDPVKGRLFRATATIPKGTIVLVDRSYSTIPSADPHGQEALVCSNATCSRRMNRTELALVQCPNKCFENVTWCNAVCQSADAKRHELECQWLKTNSKRLRSEDGDYEFITIWHIVRILASRYLDVIAGRLEDWDAVDQCCAYLESWPKEQLTLWKRLVAQYLDKDNLACTLPPEDVLLLLCKEETNTFGLYPNKTGPLETDEKRPLRGIPYGIGIFPRAARFNHSCTPNVSRDLHHCMLVVAN